MRLCSGKEIEVRVEVELSGWVSSPVSYLLGPAQRCGDL